MTEVPSLLTFDFLITASVFISLDFLKRFEGFLEAQHSIRLDEFNFFCVLMAFLWFEILKNLNFCYFLSIS